MPKHETSAFYRVLGQRIQEARVRRKISQTELGAKLGLNRTSVSNLEKGSRQLPVHLVRALTEALDVSMEELMPEVLPRPRSRNEVLENTQVLVDPKYAGDLASLLDLARGGRKDKSRE